MLLLLKFILNQLIVNKLDGFSVVLSKNENTKRASWWAIFGGKAESEGIPKDG